MFKSRAEKKSLFLTFAAHKMTDKDRGHDFMSIPFVLTTYCVDYTDRYTIAHIFYFWTWTCQSDFSASCCFDFCFDSSVDLSISRSVDSWSVIPLLTRYLFNVHSLFLINNQLELHGNRRHTWARLELRMSDTHTFVISVFMRPSLLRSF